jgi:DNA transposition AAA+ family ATPase
MSETIAAIAETMPVPSVAPEAEADVTTTLPNGPDITLALPNGMDGEVNEAEIRAAVWEVIRARGNSVTAMAKEANIGGSTLNSWLHDKYNGVGVNVARKVRTYLSSQPARERIQAVVQPMVCFAPTQTGKMFLAALTTAQFTPVISVIGALAGAGKTTACRHYASKNSNVWLITSRPSSASVFGVIEQLSQMFKVVENSVTARTQRIINKMSGSKGLLIIDEAQHLTRDALEELRAIHDASGVGLALVGNEEVWAKMDGGGRKALFAQLFRRVGMRVIRHKIDERDITALLDSQGVTGVDERKLLATIARRPGALGQMVMVLRSARLLADGEGEPVRADHIRAAWKNLTDTALGEPA